MTRVNIMTRWKRIGDRFSWVLSNGSIYWIRTSDFRAVNPMLYH